MKRTMIAGLVVAATLVPTNAWAFNGIIRQNLSVICATFTPAEGGPALLTRFFTAICRI